MANTSTNAQDVDIYGGWDWANMDRENEMAKEEYARYLEWMKPYLQAGKDNLGAFQDLINGNVRLEDTPGYKERFAAGMDALNQSLAAKRQLLGGGAARAAVQYGQEYASREFANEWMRRMQAAYARPPVQYGGHPNLPGLLDFNKKYGDMGGGSGGGDPHGDCAKQGKLYCHYDMNGNLTNGDPGCPPTNAHGSGQDGCLNPGGSKPANPNCGGPNQPPCEATTGPGQGGGQGQGGGNGAGGGGQDKPCDPTDPNGSCYDPWAGEY